mmetsp:Transcript_16350/g.41670  ORF Transcript_16350/g.41670 Transcript_16350/m.41670 type:complete len:240 (+) Transcript_16350:3043-3762(+)
MQNVQRRAHDGRVLIAEHTPQLVSHGLQAARHDGVQPVQRHDRLLAHNLVRVLEQVCHTLDHRGHDLRVDQLRDGDERRARLEVVGRLQVAPDGVDQERDELVLRVQTERAREVSHALAEQIRLLRDVHGMDVAKVGGLAEHLDIHDPHDGLLGALQPNRRGRLAQALTQRGHLIADDLLLLLLGLALADVLDQLKEVLGQMRPAHHNGVQAPRGARWCAAQTCGGPCASPLALHSAQI